MTSVVQDVFSFGLCIVMVCVTVWNILHEVPDLREGVQK